MDILSAKFANEDHGAAVIETAEFGSVAISEKDRPEEWAKMIAWQQKGGAVAVYAPPLEVAEPSFVDKIIADPAELAKLKAALGK